MKYILKVWICREIHISALGLIKNSSDNCCIKDLLRVLTEANTLLSPEISCMEHSCYSILLHSDPPSTSWNHLSEGTKKTVCTVFQWAQRAQRCWIWRSSRLQPPSGPLVTGSLHHSWTWISFPNPTDQHLQISGLFSLSGTHQNHFPYHEAHTISFLCL